MAEFSVNKQLLVQATDPLRVTEALVTATFKSILRRQEALEYIQEAIEACTSPPVKLTLAQIDTKIGALV